MGKSPLVSIIVPVHNSERFITETIKSVLAQTYKNWELILVNDCSTDNSMEVIKKFLSDKVRVINLEKNGGAAKARNRGIIEAKGEFICFLDADDLWREDKLEKQVKFMIEKDSTFSFTGYEFADKDGMPNRKIVRVPEKISYKQALKNTTIWTSTVMFDMKKLTKDDILMPNIASEDTATWWNVLKVASFADGLDENLSLYRRSGRTLSSNKLVAVKRIWMLYRKHEKLNLASSMANFVGYAFNAVGVMGDFIILIPTHSKYIGVVISFLQLIKKNWPDCPYKIVISLTGDSLEIDNQEIIYNGKNASLIDCLVNAAKKYDYKYYISFLGDAFIYRTINNYEIEDIFKTILKDNIKYCSLQNVKNYKKKKQYNKYLRYINGLDRYSHNFTAFVASKDYILNEMSKFASDLEFEKEYLGDSFDRYYDDRLIVNRNFFNLLPSITKGEWDRINYKKLIKYNPDIEFDRRRPMQSWKNSIICHIRAHIVHHISPSMRVCVKKYTERLFKIKFGVEN